MSTTKTISAQLRGVITQKNNGAFTVSTPTGSRNCPLTARLRRESGGELAVGDEVSVDAAGQIDALLPRRNWISRRSAAPMPGAHTHEQLIAANLDQVVPVFAAANPRPAWHLLDRYLVSAESAEIPALVVITKFDLAAGRPEADEIEQVAAEYRALGYPVLFTSTLDGAGLDAFRAALRAAKFDSVRGPLKFNKNHFPIQNYYLTQIAKDDKGRLVMDPKGVIFKDHADAYAKDCGMTW